MAGENEPIDADPPESRGVVPIGYDSRVTLRRRHMLARNITQILSPALCDIAQVEVVEDVPPGEIPKLSAMLDTRYWRWEHGSAMPRRRYDVGVQFAPLSGDDESANPSYDELAMRHDRIERSDEFPPSCTDGEWRWFID